MSAENQTPDECTAFLARLEAATQPGAVIEACNVHGVYCPAFRPPTCKHESVWFDRSISLRADGTERMADICIQCGADVDAPATPRPFRSIAEGIVAVGRAWDGYHSLSAIRDAAEKALEALAAEKDGEIERKTRRISELVADGVNLMDTISRLREEVKEAYDRGYADA